ncbi:MAG: hypothetical protein IJP70_12025 [Bacteroidales bacterium]|nr:hypothetical protein [Bacteroidales bacterium]
MIKLRDICFVLLGLLSTTLVAQKPRWVGNTPQEMNHTYKFVEVVSYATDIASAREEAKKKLASNEQLTRAVQVNVESGKLRNIEQTVVNGQMNETIRDQVDVRMQVSGKQFELQAYPVDEYVTQEQGLVKMHTLFMVAVEDHPVFDRTYLTTSYGVAPVLMSVVPGAGQWYKGSRVKGICFFAAEAAAVSGMLFCENKCSSYERKIKETPKFAKQYEDKKSNWETGRNVCIGAGIAVWVYNVLDAAVAKGARQVKVKPAGENRFGMVPTVGPDYAGLSLTYNF